VIKQPILKDIAFLNAERHALLIGLFINNNSFHQLKGILHHALSFKTIIDLSQLFAVLVLHCFR
jgi:hypothetical protein